MKVVLSDPAAIAIADAPLAVRKAFYKQLAFLEQDLRHPSLRAKKYDEAKDRWQARVNKDWRFYFTIEGDTYASKTSFPTQNKSVLKATFMPRRMPKTPAHSPAENLPIPVELIERRIYLIRGQKVMLDSDLAELYQVETKALNRAVHRNLSRFPRDFMFQLAAREAESLKSQIGTSNAGRGGRRYLPYAFSEHGVAMLSSALRSPRAVQMNILIIRAFVKLRDMLASHKDLAVRMEKLEATQKRHTSVMAVVVEEIKKLKAPTPAPPKRLIGFKTES
jgi:hypothetical protein